MGTMAASGWARWPLVVALGAVPLGTGLAQTYSQPAHYGDFVLAGPGESRVVELRAGGTIDASTLGGGCAGKIADAPDVQIDVQSAEGSLSISAVASEGDDLTLVINTATGGWLCDDDTGEGLNPLVEIAQPATGTYDIWVGVIGEEDFASGVLTVAQSAGGAPGVIAEAPGVEWVEEGELALGDAVSEGSFADSYTVEVRAGEEIVFDLRSTEFDGILRVVAPSGEVFTNDDYEGSTERSMVALTAGEGGTWTATATSYIEKATGAYTLSFARVAAAAPGDGRRVERGTLALDDAVDATGRHIDTFTFDGAPGRRAVIDLAADAFDPFLVMRTPSGQVLENDDAEGTLNSRIDTVLAELGTYEVDVTTYAAGLTGDYTLTIDLGQPIAPELQAGRDTIELAHGATVGGRLETTDLEFEPGRFQDLYAFAGEAGEAVRVSMGSSEFDTYLVVRSPDGLEFVNDDFDGSTAQSVVEFTLPESGRYQVAATTYGAGMTGAYQIKVTPATGLADDTPVPRVGAGRVFGIFAGISDYSQLRAVDPGWGDLDYTAEDAVRIHGALLAHAGMDPQDAHVLTDRQATRANIEAAFRDIAARIGPNDTFVFFFSGHGSQTERPGGPDMLDADGFDETLGLSDQEITDDEMRGLFDSISARVSVIILDSCYSGGFAKDVVSAPGRMGLFSSDEDVPSLVAVKFSAGGYLSYFLEEALQDGEADENDDRAIDAIEISQYLRIRYSQEAMVKARSTFDTPDFSYQHLVVDRGGVTHDTVVFRLD
jgi:hypothetical protein